VQTDRTIPNIKLDAITRNNEKETRILIDVVVLGDRNVIKKESEKRVKCGDHTIKMCKHESDTVINRGDWNYLRIAKKTY
jgi:BioD-like phosphotransacetylase family protein